MDVKKAETKYAEARREAERFREEIAHLRETHARELGDVRAQIAEDKAHVGQAIRAETDAIKRGASAELKKERKRSAAYKQVPPGAQPREAPYFYLEGYDQSCGHPVAWVTPLPGGKSRSPRLLQGAFV